MPTLKFHPAIILKNNFEEAILSQNSLEWITAINEELNSIKENGVWKLVDRPLDKE